MALEREDLKQIREIVTEVVDKKIDDFAVVIAKSFQKVDERFEQVDKRFEQVDKHLESLDFKVGLMQTDIKAIRAEIDRISQKLAALEKRSDQDTVLALTELEKIKKRVLYLEKLLKVKSA